MDENKTFKVLQRTPFHEVKKIIDTVKPGLGDLLNILEQNKWSSDDYLLALLKDSATRQQEIQKQLLPEQEKFRVYNDFGSQINHDERKWHL